MCPSVLVRGSPRAGPSAVAGAASAGRHRRPLARFCRHLCWRLHSQSCLHRAASVSFAPEQVQFKFEKVYTGLNQPTFVTNAGDGSGRMFVLERAGRIKVFAAPGSEPSSDGQMFLDIEDKVDDSGPEQGLLGLAFAPDYETSGFFYVDYTDNAGDTVVARYRVSDDPNRADKESEKQLLWVDQPAPNHNGGMLAFGPDGRLWVGLGDGGGANDTFGNGQNPNTPLGKIVRMDVSGENATSEIWATGLRNPWRFSFDRKTGDLWIADVGQDLFEEIDYVPAALVERRRAQLRLADHGGRPLPGGQGLQHRWAAAARMGVRPCRQRLLDHGRQRVSRASLQRAPGRLPVRRLLFGQHLGLLAWDRRYGAQRAGAAQCRRHEFLWRG